MKELHAEISTRTSRPRSIWVRAILHTMVTGTSPMSRPSSARWENKRCRLLRSRRRQSTLVVLADLLLCRARLNRPKTSCRPSCPRVCGALCTARALPISEECLRSLNHARERLGMSPDFTRQTAMRIGVNAEPFGDQTLPSLRNELWKRSQRRSGHASSSPGGGGKRSVLKSPACASPRRPLAPIQDTDATTSCSPLRQRLK